MMNSVSSRFAAVVWFLSCISVFGYSQKLTIETSLSPVTACPKTSLVIPVRVINMISVDSFLLTLNYDPASLTYSDIQQVNLQLAGDTLHVTDVSGIITISWKGVNPASILNDTMVKLIFQTRSGNSELSWDTSQPDKCFYLSEGTLLPSLFTGSLITLYPLITLTLDEIDPTCENTCDANYAAYARGGIQPYSYLWNGKQSLFDSIGTVLCADTNNIQITDAKGCILDSSFVIKGLPPPEVEIIITPSDTLYVQNPKFSFSFEEKPNTVSVWDWSIYTISEKNRIILYQSKSIENMYVFREENIGLDSLFLELIVQDANGCIDTVFKYIRWMEAKLFIPNVFSPNATEVGNRTFRVVNDSSRLDISDEYQRLELMIFNRYGKRVYKNDNYKSDWDGGNLPDGVYYYVLNAIGIYRTEKYKGAVTILGGGR